MPYVIPDTLPTSYTAIEVIVPDDLDFQQILSGAIIELINNWNYEQVGPITPSQAAKVFHPTVDSILEMVASMPIGSIIAYAGAALPANYLWCDGYTHPISEYPKLANALDPVFVELEDGIFSTPDLVGKTILGYGALNQYVSHVGLSGGSYTHTLTVAEMPSHTHTQQPHAHNYTTVGVIPEAALGNDLSGIDDVNITATSNTTAINNPTGSNMPHNNLPPYLTLRYIIRAR